MFPQPNTNRTSNRRADSTTTSKAMFMPAGMGPNPPSWMTLPNAAINPSPNILAKWFLKKQSVLFSKANLVETVDSKLISVQIILKLLPLFE